MLMLFRHTVSGKLRDPLIGRIMAVSFLSQNATLIICLSLFDLLEVELEVKVFGNHQSIALSIA